MNWLSRTMDCVTCNGPASDYQGYDLTRTFPAGRCASCPNYFCNEHVGHDRGDCDPDPFFWDYYFCLPCVRKHNEEYDAWAKTWSGVPVLGRLISFYARWCHIMVLQ